MKLKKILLVMSVMSIMVTACGSDQRDVQSASETTREATTESVQRRVSIGQISGTEDEEVKEAIELYLSSISSTRSFSSIKVISTAEDEKLTFYSPDAYIVIYDEDYNDQDGGSFRSDMGTIVRVPIYHEDGTWSEWRIEVSPSDGKSLLDMSHDELLARLTKTAKYHYCKDIVDNLGIEDEDVCLAITNEIYENEFNSAEIIEYPDGVVSSYHPAGPFYLILFDNTTLYIFQVGSYRGAPYRKSLEEFYEYKEKIIEENEAKQEAEKAAQEAEKAAQEAEKAALEARESWVMPEPVDTDWSNPDNILTFIEHLNAIPTKEDFISYLGQYEEPEFGSSDGDYFGYRWNISGGGYKINILFGNIGNKSPKKVLLSMSIKPIEREVSEYLKNFNASTETEYFKYSEDKFENYLKYSTDITFSK